MLSGDGKQVVCADKQGALHVLDAADGKALKTIPTGNPGGMTLLSLSPDAAKAAAYGTDGSLSLWSLAEGRRIAIKEGLVGVRALAWTRDGKAIVTGGDDKVVRIWSLPAGEETEFVVSKELKGATGAVTALETGTDLLIAASADGKVHLWNIPEARPIRELAIADVVALGLSGDGTRLAAGRADGVVQVWDLAAGKSHHRAEGRRRDSTPRLAALDWIVAAEGLEMAFQKQETARIEAKNKALDELLKKANDTIATVRKDLVEKQKALKQATDAKEAAQKALAAVADQVAKSPDGKPDPALEKSQKDAQDKLTAAAAAEGAALAAFKAREIHLKDAEVEAQNYSASQSRNKGDIAAANAAAAKAKDGARQGDGGCGRDQECRGGPKASAPGRALLRGFADRCRRAGDGSLRVWAVASGLPVQHLPGSGATTAASLVACSDAGSRPPPRTARPPAWTPPRAGSSSGRSAARRRPRRSPIA